MVSEKLPPVGQLPLSAGDAPVKLAEHAEVIRTLGKRVVGDVIEEAGGWRNAVG